MIWHPPTRERLPMMHSRHSASDLGRLAFGLLVPLLIACGGEETTSPPSGNPVPSVTAVSPEDVVRGHADFTLTVNGADFIHSSVVRWNGSDRPTTWVDAGILWAAIPASDLETPGVASVTVFNPSPGGGVSDSQTVSVLNPAPLALALSPAGAFKGYDEFTLTIEGANFVESSIVRWNESDRPTNYVDGNTLQVVIPSSDVATTGSASITVFTPPPGGGLSGNLAFPILPPPTGQIVFVSGRDGNGEIYLINADGTDQVNLTNNPADDSNPAWSPDGSRIAFVSDRDGNREVYVMNADGTGLANLTNDPADDWRTGAINDWAPAWSPDGSKILFATNRDGNDEIYVMNADGSSQTNLSNRAEQDWRPTWSPDGSKIAWVTDPEPGNWEVYVMNADGTGQVNLTNTAGSLDYSPTWSPDGSRIAFASSRDVPSGLRDEVYVMNADGSNPVNLTNNAGDDTEPTWSPDGSWVAFIARDSGWSLRRVRPDGTNETLLGHAWPPHPPVWSPDGSWLACYSKPFGDGDIYLTDVNGLLQLNLTDTEGIDSQPDWRPGF